LDLEYIEDKDAEVDFNLVMTGAGEFIEVQGTGEEATFSRDELNRLLELGEAGIRNSSSRWWRWKWWLSTRSLRRRTQSPLR